MSLKKDIYNGILLVISIFGWFGYSFSFLVFFMKDIYLYLQLVFYFYSLVFIITERIIRYHLCGVGFQIYLQLFSFFNYYLFYHFMKKWNYVSIRSGKPKVPPEPPSLIDKIIGYPNKEGVSGGTFGSPEREGFQGNRRFPDEMQSIITFYTRLFKPKISFPIILRCYWCNHTYIFLFV